MRWCDRQILSYQHCRYLVSFVVASSLTHCFTSTMNELPLLSPSGE